MAKGRHVVGMLVIIEMLASFPGGSVGAAEAPAARSLSGRPVPMQAIAAAPSDDGSGPATSGDPAAAPSAGGAATTAFNSLVDAYLQSTFRAHPSRATSEGVHDFDGELENLSRQAIEGEVRELESFLAAFEKVDRAGLDAESVRDLDLVTSDVRARLLELTARQSWRKDPDLYSSAATAAVFVLIKRDFAPLEERLRSVIAREKRIPALLEEGKKNLDGPPRIYTEIALEQMPGIIDFFQKSVPEAFRKVKDRRLLDEFAAANSSAVEALERYQSYLKEKVLPASNGSFALGADLYRKKLLYEEMVDEPLDSLLARGDKELRRLQRDFIETARCVDPKRPAREVFESVSAEHPQPSELIDSVTSVLEGIREFCLRKQIVTIPSEERARVEETPPFMRALSFASMDTPGPFERKAREAYYHVTVPEPTWDARKTEEHMRSFSRLDLVNTSVHEAYPGHYVQFLWVPRVPSTVRKVVGCGSNAEGWAHYCEEMMLEEGLGDGDPKLKLVQLHDALLRACRYICGIRMHTQGMTVDEATRFFMEEGYQEKANAEREAKRGTMDPTYLVYTLGKLDILALREDYRKAKGKDFSLKDFHDRFLSQGFPPLKIVRAALLGEAGSAAAGPLVPGAEPGDEHPPAPAAPHPAAPSLPAPGSGR